MILLFTLSMPGRNSWDGQWSGEDRYHAITRNFNGTFGYTNLDSGRHISEKGYYHYSFGDGWAAGVSVKEVTSREAEAARKKSSGFCGYDWMVDSIIQHDKIQVEVRHHPEGTTA